MGTLHLSRTHSKVYRAKQPDESWALLSDRWSLRFVSQGNLYADRNDAKGL